MSTTEQVKKVIAEALSIDIEINDSDTLDDLGADSLDGIEIVMDLEERFDVEITDEDVTDATTVHDFIVVVENALEAK